MKKVLLLGDSIRMGYDEYVKDMLKGEYEVIYPVDNGRFAAYTLWQANQMLKGGDIALVHFNNGYWDMNIEAPMTEQIHPLEEYKSFLRRIVKLSRDCGAKVVFATTVPILDSGESADNTGVSCKINYNNQWVKDYNFAALELMKELCVPVNDLYSLCLEDKNYYKCSDMLHLTEKGYCRCAEQTVSYIRNILK